MLFFVLIAVKQIFCPSSENISEMRVKLKHQQPFYYTLCNTIFTTERLRTLCVIGALLRASLIQMIFVIFSGSSSTENRSFTITRPVLV